MYARRNERNGKCRNYSNTFNKKIRNKLHYVQNRNDELAHKYMRYMTIMLVNDPSPSRCATFSYVWREKYNNKRGGWESKRGLVDFTDGFRINCWKRGRARIRGVAVSRWKGGEGRETAVIQRSRFFTRRYFVQLTWPTNSITWPV